jgi:hypothetical protein
VRLRGADDAPEEDVPGRRRVLAAVRARLRPPALPGPVVRIRMALADANARRHLRRVSMSVTRAAVLTGFVSVVLAAGAFAASTLYAQYGAPRMHASADAWIDRAATYDRTDCRQCHGTESAAEASAAHAELICETCHVPSVAHPGTVPSVVRALPAPTSAICATCHTQAAGRPAAFPQVALSEHYPGADCLRCHDPHTSAAASPPEVPHPLANLPACVTCHAPGGLKRFPAGHQPAADGVCRSCHRPGIEDSPTTVER